MPRHDKDKRIFLVENYHLFKSSLKVIEACKQQSHQRLRIFCFKSKIKKTHGQVLDIYSPQNQHCL